MSLNQQYINGCLSITKSTHEQQAEIVQFSVFWPARLYFFFFFFLSFSVMLHVMRWVRGIAETWAHLVYFTFRADKVSRGSGQSLGLRCWSLQSVVCLFVVSGVAAVTSAAQTGGLDRKTSVSVGGPERATASPISFSCQSYWFTADCILKENHLLWHYSFAQIVNSFMQVDKALVDCYPNQGRQRFMTQCLPASLALREQTRVHLTI